jgi:hypothetical protein
MTSFWDGLTGTGTDVPKTSIVRSASVVEPVGDEVPSTDDDELTSPAVRSAVEPSTMVRLSMLEDAAPVPAIVFAFASSPNWPLVTLKGPTVVLKEMANADLPPAGGGGTETAADSSGPMFTGTPDTVRATSRTVDELSILVTPALAGDAASVAAAKTVAAKAPTPAISCRLSFMTLTPFAWMTIVLAATAVPL